MQNEETVAHEARSRIIALAYAHLLAENAEHRERILDLEADNRALRETLHACVEMFQRSQVQLARYQRSVIELTRATRRSHQEAA